MISSACQSSASLRGPAALEVHLLGLVDFESSLFLQERMVHEISGRNDLQGGLLVCEHPPQITIGREGREEDLAVEPRELVARQLPVRRIGRGGGCVVHTPGQVAVYPIVPLQRLGWGIGDFRQRMEEAVIDVCGDLKLTAFRDADKPGVWCRNGRLATVGMAVKSWVSWHGVFVNVAPSLELMRLCDASCERITSLAAERHSQTLMHAARAGLVRRTVERLGYARHHLFTGHPLLKRTRVPANVPA